MGLHLGLEPDSEASGPLPTDLLRTGYRQGCGDGVGWGTFKRSRFAARGPGSLSGRWWVQGYETTGLLSQVSSPLLNNWRSSARLLTWSTPSFPHLKAGCVLPHPLPPHKDSVRQCVKRLGKPCPLLLLFAAGEGRTGSRACQAPGTGPRVPIVQAWLKGSEVPGSDIKSLPTWMTGFWPAPPPLPPHGSRRLAFRSKVMEEREGGDPRDGLYHNKPDLAARPQ